MTTEYPQGATPPPPNWTRRIIIGGSSILTAGLLTVGGFGLAINNANQQAQNDRNAPIVEPFVPSFITPDEGDSPTDVSTAAAEAEAARQALAAQQAADAAAAAQAAQSNTRVHHNSVVNGGGSDPIKCPPGTVAGGVDSDGNEYACAPPCEAYDDNNVCITPGALIYTIPKPVRINT